MQRMNILVHQALPFWPCGLLPHWEHDVTWCMTSALDASPCVLINTTAHAAPTRITPDVGGPFPPMIVRVLLQADADFSRVCGRGTAARACECEKPKNGSR
jgi:hypothetical protein